jgi:hypothetical protein
MSAGADKTASAFKYKFELKPIYEITNIRKNSTGENSGLQRRCN